MKNAPQAFVSATGQGRKTPRNCRLIPEYRQYCSELGCQYWHFRIQGQFLTWDGIFWGKVFPRAAVSPQRRSAEHSCGSMRGSPFCFGPHKISNGAMHHLIFRTACRRLPVPWHSDVISSSLFYLYHLMVQQTYCILDCLCVCLQTHFFEIFVWHKIRRSSNSHIL